jgi:hypothetical protein
MRERWFGSNDSHAVANSERIERPALGKELFQFYLARVKRAPERQFAQVGVLDPVQIAGQISLDRDTPNIFQVAQLTESILI